MKHDFQTYIMLVVGVITAFILVHTIRYFNDED